MNLGGNNSQDRTRTIAIVAGVVVAGGLLLAYTGRQRKCRNLRDVHDEDSPLHLTSEAQEEAHAAAERAIYEVYTSGSDPNVSELYLKVAEKVESCADWEDDDTDEIKESFEGIKKIVDSALVEFNANKDAFVARVRGS